MTKTLTEQWAIITPENCQEINTMISEYKKKIESLQEQLEEDIKTTKDQELIIKKLKRRRICTNQKEKARKEHINELIAQVKELKEEVARRGCLINELKSQRKEANEVIKHYANDENWCDYYEVLKKFFENGEEDVKEGVFK